MKFMLFSVLIVSIVVLCQAGIGHVQYPPNPKYPGKCVISESLILSPGDIVKDPKVACGSVKCVSPNEAEFRICVPVGAPKGYTFGDFLDTSKPFPACCEQELIKVEH